MSVHVLAPLDDRREKYTHLWRFPRWHHAVFVLRLRFQEAQLQLLSAKLATSLSEKNIRKLKPIGGDSFDKP